MNMQVKKTARERERETARGSERGQSEPRESSELMVNDLDSIGKPLRESMAA